MAGKKACGLNLNKTTFSEELFVLVCSFMGDRPAVNGKYVIESGDVDNGETGDSFCTKKRKRGAEQTEMKKKMKEVL